MNYREKLLRILYPATCPMCQNTMKYNNDKGICDKCEKEVEFISEPFCMKCGKTLEDENLEYCYDCERLNHIYTQGRALFTYNEITKRSIYQFKYKNKREYVDYYTEQIKRKLGDVIEQWEIDAIVPIPLHKSKMIARGYNQTEVIADSLEKKIGIKKYNSILRVKKTMPQKSLNNVERMKNLENAFKLSSDVVNFKHPLLIDDIYTTGHTIDACTKVLLEANVQKVFFLTLCIGQGL